MKNEMYYGRQWRSADELEAVIHGYIDFYNTARIKVSLGGYSITQYRVDIIAKAQFRLWLDWLLLGWSQRQLPVSRSKFKRDTAWCWQVTPEAAITGEVHRWIMLDGTYFNGICVLIANTKKHVINWQFCDREKTVAWEALLAKIPPPDIAVIDGQRGLEAAIRNLWPETKIQRCYFHIR